MEKEKMVYETPIIEVESFDIECKMDDPTTSVTSLDWKWGDNPGTGW